MGEDAPEVALNLQQGGKGLPSGVTPQPPILPRSCPLHYLVKPPDLEAEGAGAWTAFSSPFLPPMLTQPRWTTLKAHCGVFCGPVCPSLGRAGLFICYPATPHLFCKLLMGAVFQLLSPSTTFWKWSDRGVVV